MKVYLPPHGIESVSYLLEQGEYVVDRHELTGLPRPGADEDLYRHGLYDLNESFDVARDESTGITVEVGGVNLDKLEAGNVVLFPSTRFSSLSQNIGNAIELAGMGAANPNTSYLYAAYPGNGRSRGLRGRDKQYFMNTGRLTAGSVADPTSFQAIEHISAMERAVRSHFGVGFNHVSANESGGRLGIALMAAAPRDSVEDAFLNGLQGVSPDASYGEISMLREDLKSQHQRRGEDHYEPGKVNAETKKEAKKLLPNIYKGIEQKAIVAGTYARAINFDYFHGTLNMNRRALHGHDNLNDTKNHAVMQDVLGAVVRQESLITKQANFGDPEQGISEEDIEGINSCIEFGRLVMEHIPVQKRSEKRGVEFIIGRGRLDAHTDAPATRLAIERRAFRSSIATFMRLVFSGDPDTMLATTGRDALADVA